MLNVTLTSGYYHGNSFLNNFKKALLISKSLGICRLQVEYLMTCVERCQNLLNEVLGADHKLRPNVLSVYLDIQLK